MSIKLEIINGVIAVSEGGSYVVPDNTPIDPLRMDRFYITPTGNIALVAALEGIPNAEIDTTIKEETRKLDFAAKKKRVVGRIWGLITEKVIFVKKEVRGKPYMSDEDFATLMETDLDRVKSAEEGRDVFLLQASMAGKTQAEIRSGILAESALWKEEMLLLDDKIETVRIALEGMVDVAQVDEDLSHIGKVIDDLDILDSHATTADIIQILSQ